MGQCILCGEAADFLKGNEAYCKECAEIEFGDISKLKPIMPNRNFKKKAQDIEIKIKDEFD